MTGNEYAQANVRAASAMLTCRISESYWRRTNWLNSETESVDALLIAWFLSDCVVQMVFYMRAVSIHRNLFISVHCEVFWRTFHLMWSWITIIITVIWPTVESWWKSFIWLNLYWGTKHKFFFKSLVMCVSYLFILETFQNLCVEVSQS